jgi:hypothetical protein
MLPGSGRCEYHPDRAGVGICVECRKVICVECTTQFEGINRCARCLAEKLQSAKTLAERRDWGFGNILLGLISFAAVFGTVFLFAFLVES